MNKHFHFIIIITSIVSFISCILVGVKEENGYEWIVILPLVFLFCYLFIGIRLIKSQKYKITTYAFIIQGWLRFTIIPFVIMLSNKYNAVDYIEISEILARKAIFLMVYEIVIIHILLLFTYSFLGNGKRIHNKPKLEGSKLIYLMFILLGGIVYITFGRSNNLLAFLFIPTSGEQFTDITDTNYVLARQVILCSVIIAFLWLVDFCKRKYEIKFEYRFIIFSIFIALLNVSIIVGERRSTQMYSAICCILVLLYVFPKYKKTIITMIAGTAIIIIGVMSVYKFFGAFYLGSYSAAFENTNIDLSWLSTTLQSYFFGPQNVATALKMNDYVELNFFNLVFDFLRSIFGLSFLMPEKYIMTVEYFNSFIYGVERSNGHVISGIGYGYIYLGFIFSPLFIYLNILLSLLFEKYLYHAKSIETVYLWGYLLARFSTNLFVNTPPLLSLSTIYLGTLGLLIFVSISTKKIISKA